MTETMRQELAAVKIAEMCTLRAAGRHAEADRAHKAVDDLIGEWRMVGQGGWGRWFFVWRGQVAS
jgi:hypothetical protein